MSKQSISIDLIKTDREPDLTWIQELVDDIHDVGLQVPILVDRDLVLIDGLRRLAAFKLLERTKISAIVAETYEEAVSNLKQAHLNGPSPGPRRIWEITVGLDGLLKERTKRLRAKYARVPIGQRGTVEREPRSRELFADALNDRYVNHYASVYRAAEAGDKFAQELIKLMETNVIAASTAMSRMGDRNRVAADVRSESEQRALLSSASRGLSGITKGLDKLGKPIKLPRTELLQILKELKNSRAKLVRQIREIEKESNRE
jgi:ParB-like nuclease domain